MADAQREANDAKTRLSKRKKISSLKGSVPTGTKPTRTNSMPNLLMQESSVSLGDYSSRPMAHRNKSGKSWLPSPKSTTNALISKQKTKFF